MKNDKQFEVYEEYFHSQDSLRTQPCPELEKEGFQRQQLDHSHM